MEVNEQPGKNDEQVGINTLPSEILCLIFSNLSVIDLDSVTQVCRRWEELLKLHCIWKDKDILIREGQTTDEVRQMSRCLLYAKEVKSTSIVDVNLEHAKFNFTRFVCLRSSKCQTRKLLLCMDEYPAELITWISRQTKLLSLTLVDFYPNETQSGILSLVVEVMELLPRLQYLDISESSILEIPFAAKLLAGLLPHVPVHAEGRLTTFKYLPDHEPVLGLYSVQAVEKIFSVNRYNLTVIHMTLWSAEVVKCVGSCPNLKEANLRYEIPFNFSDVETMINSVIALKLLMPDFTTHHVQEIIERPHKMKLLDIHSGGINCFVAGCVTRSLRRLQETSIEKCYIDSCILPADECDLCGEELI